MIRKIILIALSSLLLSTANSEVSRQTADSIANILNQREIICDKTCPLFESENSRAGLVNTLFIDVLAIIGAVWLYSNYKKKYFIGIGAAVVIVVTGSLFLQKSNTNQCIEYSDANCKVISAGQNQKKQNNALSEFQQLDTVSSVATSASISEEFSSIDSPTTTVTELPASSQIKITDPNVLDPIIAFILLVFISIGMKNKSFVHFRSIFLLFGIVWFGFYRGGCNCMISSFQELILGISRGKFVWTNLIWLGILIIATYFFGRIWCGWLCHLGGIQDFLFHSPKLKIMSSEKSQKYLRITRYVIFVIWILQLIFTQKNIFCQYDPFKSLFNLIFTDWISIALLILLLLSSVLIYRPFCRTICPVGIILGWISLIPGAKRMRIESGCVNCGSCSKECAMHAITLTKTKSRIETENCISCGECTTICRKNSIKN